MFVWNNHILLAVPRHFHGCQIEATNISPVREEKDIEWVLKLQLVLTAAWQCPGGVKRVKEKQFVHCNASAPSAMPLLGVSVGWSSVSIVSK